MIERIISFSIRNRLITGFLVLCLIAAGIHALSRLPIDAVPDITNNQVQVITRSPALGAPDVERLVTFPIEQACANLPGIIELRSFSRFGLSVVTIVFEDNQDIYLCRQQVAERLQQARNEIPSNAGNPELGPVTTGLGEIYQYVVRAAPGYEDKFSAEELRTIQDWTIRKQLLGTPGVADVSSFGGLLKEYEVAVSPQKLNSFGLSLEDLVHALEAQNENTGGAYIEKGPQVYFIRSEGLIGSIEDIRNTPVKTGDRGTPLLLSDVAEVRFGHATRYGAMVYNGEKEVTGAVVMMLKGENSSAVIKKVKERMDAIRRTLPEGVVIEAFLDRDKMVGRAIGTVQKNLLEGALIVILVLVFFLGNLRAGLLVASVIPLSMLFALIMMNLFGVSGNLMSLGALDFGLIIDGAVIITEAVLHNLHRKVPGLQLSRSQMEEEVQSSAGRMMSAAMFGQLIILVVYLPILSLEGIEGKMFRPMAQTVAFALMGAFLLSLTYVPMMSAWMLDRKTGPSGNFSDRFMHRIEIVYKQMLLRAFRLRTALSTMAVGLLAGAILLLSSMGGEFIPQLEEGDFAVETRLLTGSSLSASVEYTSRASKLLLERFPEVLKVVTKTGSGEIPTDPMPIEASDMMVILKEREEWSSASNFDELASKMSEALQEIPGLSCGFQFPVQMRFNELMTGARQDVVCKIYGEDLDTLAHYANRLSGLIKQVPGACDLYVESMKGMPQIVVNCRREALARYGVSVQTINQAVSAGFAGMPAGQVFENEKRFGLVVRLKSAARHDLSDVQNLPIRTASGALMPLSQLAEVKLIDGPGQIQRENFSRRITVGFNVRDQDVQTVVNRLREKADKIQLPSGYFIHYGGTFENLQKATARLQIAVPLALALIFFLLYLAFSSMRMGLLIFTAIPFSAIGGILSLWLRGMPFSISAGIGFIALFGVAVLNGIVLITEFRRIRDNYADLSEGILEASVSRLRPVLMTAAVAALGFMPMAISTSAGAEVQKPLATVVIGGLISSTLLTLFLLPAWYLRLENKRKKSNITAMNMMIPGILLLLFSSLPGFAQPIELSEAEKLCLKNNGKSRAAAYRTQAAQKLSKGWLNLPATNLAAEVGQFNSLNIDSRFAVSQSIEFPTVYQAEKKLLEAEYTRQQAGEDVLKAELIRDLRKVFYRQRILKEKLKAILFTDSLLQETSRRISLQFSKGEVDQTVKLQNESRTIQQQSRRLAAESELKELEIYFNMMMGENGDKTATNSPLLMELPEFETANSPLSRQAAAETESSNRAWISAKQKLYPGLSFSYNNLSLRGWQRVADQERFFGAGYRFHSGMAGLNIPIFYGGLRSRAAAAKLNWMETRSIQEQTEKEQNMQMERLKLSVATTRDILKTYETQILPDSRRITELITRRFRSGEISYTEWSIQIRQESELRLEYLDHVQLFNESVAEILFLQGK